MPAKKKTTSKKTTVKKKAVKKAAPAIPIEETGPLCMVGIGASAGGLEALEGLFSKMPPDTEYGFCRYTAPGAQA